MLDYKTLNMNLDSLYKWDIIDGNRYNQLKALVVRSLKKIPYNSPFTLHDLQMMMRDDASDDGWLLHDPLDKCQIECWLKIWGWFDIEDFREDQIDPDYYYQRLFPSDETPLLIETDDSTKIVKGCTWPAHRE